MGWRPLAGRRWQVASDGARNAAALGLAALLSACASPQSKLLSRFEARLAGQDSATAALGEWCAEHGIADPPAIRAGAVAGGTPALPPDLARLLRLAPHETARLRHVRLSCGEKVLSEALNWYVPARLPPAMNQALETGDTPFGRVIAPLGFRRERIFSQRGRARGCPAGTILSHRALLLLPDGRPVSFVSECYTGANLPVH
jgi:hypothetical protein